MKKFLEYSIINESSNLVKKRSDLAVGKLVKTDGVFNNAIDMGESRFESMDLSDQIGIIIEAPEYGNYLIQYITKFDKRLHSGYDNVGKEKQCLYVPLSHIKEVLSDELSIKIQNKDLIPYSCTKNLARIFKRMKFKPTEEYLDSSFLDVNKDNMDMISYLPSKRFEGDPNTKKGRQETRVGRIFKKLNPKLTDKQVEEFVESYRAAFKIIILGEGKNIEVVTGDDIHYWYNRQRYAPGPGSELWNSCMSGEHNPRNMFSLYCDNPDCVGLCVSTNENDKLMARALVWRIDDGRVYMDRIYAINAAEKRVLMDYAEQNGMCSYNKGGIRKKLEVTLPRDYRRNQSGNPYLDTFAMGEDRVGGKVRYFLYSNRI